MTDEEKLKAQQDVLKAQQRELLKKLKAIGADFWSGSPQEDGAEHPAGGGQAGSAASPTGTAGPAVAPGNTPRPQDSGTVKRSEVTGRPVIGIENLWMTADETVDWTEALAHDRPTDGLTAPGVWRFFHEHAERVLIGDVQAYAAVLRKINPLGDLTAYADGLTMRAPSAERLEGQFTCRDDLLKQYDRKYLAAMGLRIARDLMANLPVTEVGVTAYNEGNLVMEVTYPREALRHVSFRFVDPVEMTEACGGKFA